MRLKTIKRLAILIGVIGLVSGSAVWGWNWQITRMAHGKVLQAEEAVKKGEFATAEGLYREHMELVVPVDIEIQLAYADALSRGGSIIELSEALRVYDNVLKKKGLGKDDVRRKQMELRVKAGRLVVANEPEAGAEFDLKMLLDQESNKNDGELLFWSGRCAEAGKNDLAAASFYQRAIKADTTPDIKIDSYWHLANVLRHRLDKPEQADQAIEKMVESYPNNYKVYVERGRYRRLIKLPEGAADFKKIHDLAAADLKKALELNDREPEVYVEMTNADFAEMARATTAEDRQQVAKDRLIHARQILEDGLRKNPAAAALYQQLATVEWRSNNPVKAIETLERRPEAACREE